jgi:hypothetical protein
MAGSPGNGPILCPMKWQASTVALRIRTTTRVVVLLHGRLALRPTRDGALSQAEAVGCAPNPTTSVQGLPIPSTICGQVAELTATRWPPSPVLLAPTGKPLPSGPPSIPSSGVSNPRMPTGWHRNGSNCQTAAHPAARPVHTQPLAVPKNWQRVFKLGSLVPG